jgi:hypothetical protein
MQSAENAARAVEGFQPGAGPMRKKKITAVRRPPERQLL